MALTQQIVVSRLVGDRSKLLAYIWSIVHNHHAAEDVFQEVVVAAMSHAEDVKDEEHLLTWARQAARFRGIDWLRRNKRQPQLLDEGTLDLLESEWRRMDVASSQEWIDALRLCVRKLTDYARRLIDLRYVQGLSGKEIADQVGRPTRTVYVALGRIYRQLEHCVEQNADAE